MGVGWSSACSLAPACSVLPGFFFWARENHTVMAYLHGIIRFSPRTKFKCWSRFAVHAALEPASLFPGGNLA